MIVASVDTPLGQLGIVEDTGQITRLLWKVSPQAPSTRLLAEAVNQVVGYFAGELGTSPQPLGNACGANSIPIIIPCHRVLSAMGWVVSPVVGASIRNSSTQTRERIPAAVLIEEIRRNYRFRHTFRLTTRDSIDSIANCPTGTCSLKTR